jgi:hypothetical protein
MTWTSRIKRGAGKYCSRECTDKGKRVNGTYDKLAEEMREGEYRKCEVCDTEFYADRYRIELGQGRFCSQACSANNRSIGKPRELMTIKCAWCECNFETYNANRKYCHYDCFVESRKHGEYRKCETCDEEFYVQKNQIESGNGRYCSRVCFSEAIKQGKYPNLGADRGGEYRNCLICSAEFYLSPSRIESGYGYYCSRECAHAGQRRGDIFECLVCGNEFYLPPSKIAEERKYCSRSCYMKDENKKRWESGTYDGVFQSPTSIEIATAEALTGFELIYKQEYRPDDYSRPFDFLVGENLLIEVQGDYWHNRPGARERDAEKAQWAQENGYQLVEFWEYEIHDMGATELIRERVIPLVGD